MMMTGNVEINSNHKVVLVTGGTGYVGGWCIALLLKQGYTVRTTVRGLEKEQTVRASIAAEVDPGDRLSFYAADLTSDNGWDEAVAGCDYVLHVASPLGHENARDLDSLVGPARDGALRVLRASVKASVQRVVMTSSLAACTQVSYSEEAIIDESLWSDPKDNKLDAYRKSKVLSEMAAWQFMEEHGGRTSLTTILPGAIFGPILSQANQSGSARVIERIVKGRMPGTPRIGFEIVDVRDLAELHILAMTSEAAAGQRFIAVGGFMRMHEIAQELRAKLGGKASKAPTRMIPDFVLRVLAIFDAWNARRAFIKRTKRSDPILRKIQNDWLHVLGIILSLLGIALIVQPLVRGIFGNPILYRFLGWLPEGWPSLGGWIVVLIIGLVLISITKPLPTKKSE
ncbi:nucleoside-diphosphate-sugar epimerase [Paenibacillus taihuensis]|uniref:Nucleoside-diphosphate-sugar epimerase n=1 Tax=Paenibacillus taihuensis TaxID=1156355 RepID=A0A3D9S204_9BACL|nr:NAD-dependent epimerase/dehydratase family protein [Paenibacillus taihuensis]REE83914.1 nucleoside-diphosphate-sugar epimerase [Paenibacillus taihuensis]